MAEFLLKPEHILVRQMAREFAEKEVKPLASILDEEERFPVETVPKLFRYGFFGAAYPESEGGEGGDVTPPEGNEGGEVTPPEGSEENT